MTVAGPNRRRITAQPRYLTEVFRNLLITLIARLSDFRLSSLSRAVSFLTPRWRTHDRGLPLARGRLDLRFLAWNDGGTTLTTKASRSRARTMEAAELWSCSCTVSAVTQTNGRTQPRI